MPKPKRDSSIIKLNEPNFWVPVIRWISARFHEVDLRPDEHFIVSPSIASGLSFNIPPSESIRQLRLSWEIISFKWREEILLYTNADTPSESLLTLITETNIWIDSHFPPSKGPLGIERRRLLASLRQRKLRQKNKLEDKPSLSLSSQITAEILAVAKQQNVDATKLLAEVVRLVLTNTRLIEIACSKLK
jgi:hypothetical protein